MTALIILLLLVALTAVTCYAVTKRQDLREADDALNRALADNIELRREVSSHELCLGLLLAELEDLS